MKYAYCINNNNNIKEINIPKDSSEFCLLYGTQGTLSSFSPPNDPKYFYFTWFMIGT